jgi:SAM-dependent methyltransferase
MPDLAAAVDVLHLFGDPTRVRLLALLGKQELTVAEIMSVTELAQSRVSTHLGKLREAGVLRDRRVGASTYYARNDGAMPADARRLWTLLESELDDSLLRADQTRCEALIRARADQKQWPDAIAGEMERHYSPGRTWESLARAFLGLFRLGDVLDVGCGDGAIAQLLAPRAKSITCLDQSEKMIDAARKRLGAISHVRCVVGDAHALPFGDARFDQVLLFNVLTQVQTPAKVVAEAARVLRPKGSLSIVVLEAHDHRDVTAAYHHLHAGFRPAALRKMLEREGLSIERCEVSSRERRPPNFRVVSAFAEKP